MIFDRRYNPADHTIVVSYGYPPYRISRKFKLADTQCFASQEALTGFWRKIKAEMEAEYRGRINVVL